jgi:hypothetical protein
LGKERLHFGIAGTQAHNLVLACNHPFQAVGTTLFVFHYQYSHVFAY